MDEIKALVPMVITRLLVCSVYAAILRYSIIALGGTALSFWGLLGVLLAVVWIVKQWGNGSA